MKLMDLEVHYIYDKSEIKLPYLCELKYSKSILKND
jgi:hypothetical protein